MELKERFLKYVSYDTQSCEDSTTFPSTDKQKVLLADLADEMRALGMTEVTMDEYGYVMGTIPASKGKESAPVIGFISHVDPSCPIYVLYIISGSALTALSGKELIPLAFISFKTLGFWIPQSAAASPYPIIMSPFLGV